MKHYIFMHTFQEDYQSQLSKIIGLKCSTMAKIRLLSSLQQELRKKCNLSVGQQINQSKALTQQTLCSESSQQLQQQICELEKKIIMKRDVKIQLNQQIQDAEDECQSVQKTVFMKQQLDDELKRKIDMKMFEIQMAAYQNNQKQTTKKKNVNKTFSLFSTKVIDFFN